MYTEIKMRITAHLSETMQVRDSGTMSLKYSTGFGRTVDLGFEGEQTF